MGNCFFHAGQPEEARGWYERAVTETEQGDPDGVVDGAGLSRTLYLVGECYARASDEKEAKRWFDRAARTPK